MRIEGEGREVSKGMIKGVCQKNMRCFEKGGSVKGKMLRKREPKMAEGSNGEEWRQKRRREDRKEC